MTTHGSPERPPRRKRNLERWAIGALAGAAAFLLLERVLVRSGAG